MKTSHIVILLFMLLLLLLRGTVAINISESLPKGIYLKSDGGEPEPGSLVIFQNSLADSMGTARGYIRRGASLGKRVAAVPGDTIRMGGGQPTEVNGRKAGRRALGWDSLGRPVDPILFEGVVPEGKLLVLGETENSFDSRYYGFIAKAEVTGTLKPLFTWR